MTYIFAMRVIRNEQFFKVGLNERTNKRTNERHKIFMKLGKPHFGSILKPFSLKNSNKRMLLKLLYSNFCHYAVATSCKKSKRFYEQFHRKTPDKQKTVTQTNGQMDGGFFIGPSLHGSNNSKQT